MEVKKGTLKSDKTLSSCLGCVCRATGTFYFGDKGQHCLILLFVPNSKRDHYILPPEIPCGISCGQRTCNCLGCCCALGNSAMFTPSWVFQAWPVAIVHSPWFDMPQLIIRLRALSVKCIVSDITYQLTGALCCPCLSPVHSWFTWIYQVNCATLSLKKQTNKKPPALPPTSKPTILEQLFYVQVKTKNYSSDTVS